MGRASHASAERSLNAGWRRACTRVTWRVIRRSPGGHQHGVAIRVVDQAHVCAEVRDEGFPTAAVAGLGQLGVLRVDLVAPVDEELEHRPRTATRLLSVEIDLGEGGGQDKLVV